MLILFRVYTAYHEKTIAQSFEGFGRACHRTKAVEWSFEGINIFKETMESNYWSLGRFSFLSMLKAAGVICTFWGPPSFAKPLVVRWLSSGVESLASDLNSRLILWRNETLYQKHEDHVSQSIYKLLVWFVWIAVWNALKECLLFSLFSFKLQLE